MKQATINGHAYNVEPVFNMVLNYEFTHQKTGKTYLVDGEDVTEFGEEQGVNFDTTDGVTLAIEYAHHYASEIEDGAFWWKVKGE